VKSQRVGQKVQYTEASTFSVVHVEILPVDITNIILYFSISRVVVDLTMNCNKASECNNKENFIELRNLCEVEDVLCNFAY